MADDDIYPGPWGVSGDYGNGYVDDSGDPEERRALRVQYLAESTAAELRAVEVRKLEAICRKRELEQKKEQRAAAAALPKIRKVISRSPGRVPCSARGEQYFDEIPFEIGVLAGLRRSSFDFDDD